MYQPFHDNKYFLRFTINYSFGRESGKEQRKFSISIIYVPFFNSLSLTSNLRPAFDLCKSKTSNLNLF